MALHFTKNGKSEQGICYFRNTRQNSQGDNVHVSYEVAKYKCWFSYATPGQPVNDALSFLRRCPHATFSLSIKGDAN